jgi:hypothetical protein
MKVYTKKLLSLHSTNGWRTWNCRKIGFYRFNSKSRTIKFNFLLTFTTVHYSVKSFNIISQIRLMYILLVSSFYNFYYKSYLILFENYYRERGVISIAFVCHAIREISPKIRKFHSISNINWNTRCCVISVMCSILLMHSSVAHHLSHWMQVYHKTASLTSSILFLTKFSPGILRPLNILTFSNGIYLTPFKL